jgi:radical SAM superfamily enzyme YgiQ (UPF0313 family)
LIHPIASRRKTIVLVRPPYSLVYSLFGELPRDREVRPPLGLLQLAGSLLRRGHRVRIIDGEPALLGVERLVRLILAERPDFVGVTSTTPEIDLVRRLVSAVKRSRPRIVTVLGGAHASALPEATLELIPELDHVVVGEGENAIVALVENRPVEPVVRAPAIEDLDDLPFPPKHLLAPAHYRYPHPRRGMVTLDALETSRGCPHDCSFCFHLDGRATRFKSPERVREELRRSRADFGADMVMFFDDTFTLRKERALRMLDGMAGDGTSLGYSCWTRADSLRPEIVRAMRRAGFVKCSVGVESADPAMLRRLRKGTTLEQFRRAFTWLHRAGIETRGSFIVGGPHETRESVDRSIAFARGLDLFRVGVNIATPYPGTRLYEQALAGEGIELVESDWSRFTRWGRAVVRTETMSPRDLEAAQRRFLSRFYGSPKVVAYHLERFLRGNRSRYYYRPLLWSLAHRAGLRPAR